jgi:hypothetical protein
MATLTINGRRVKVDDSFLSLSREQQDATVDEIAASMGQAGAPSVAQLQGKVAPQGSSGEVSQNLQGLDTQGRYDFEVGRVADRYFPGSDKSKVAAQYPAYDAGKLFNAGLTLGFGDEAAGAGQALGNVLTGRPGDIGQAFTDFTALERERQKLGQAQQGGLGTAAEIGGALMSGRPDVAAARVSGLIPAMVQGAKGGAMGGGVYGFGSTDGDLTGRLTGAAKGAAGGAAFGAAVPAVVAGVRKVISPSSTSAATSKAAQTLKREGVDLTAGQATGNQNLRYREAELGGAKADAFMEKQAGQFTAAALKRAGISSPRATHDVIDQGFSAIGQQFDDLATRNHIQPDQKLATDLQKAWRRFEGVTNPGTRPKVIERLIADIYGQGRNARIAGPWYKSTRTELGKLTTHENPDLAEAARDMMVALDDAMERTIQKTNPGDLGGWREARRLYKNMLVIRDAATRAGAASAEGLITPQALRSAAIKQNKVAFARGRNEFVDLADAGVSTMTPLPNSGTPGRLNAKSVLPIGAATGAGIGGTIGGLPGAAVGGVVGAAAPWAVGRAILSGPGRSYLGNQLAAGPIGSRSSLLGSLLGRGEQPLLQ